MARKPSSHAVTTTAPDFDENAVRPDLDALDQVAVLNADASERARAMALSIGYDGTMTVGAIEDEIRFYQRRTVEACLELGKRLLILKELTPHGEFVQRIELLGLNDRTARRFMQAAAKTAKSANLSTLSTQVRSVSAFLELVTLDDEVLEDISEMDDFDRMSASQLRVAARKMQQEKEALERLNNDKNKKLDDLTTRQSAVDPWDEKVGQFKTEIAGGFDLLDDTVGRLWLIHAAILKDGVTWGGDEDAERVILRQFAVLFHDRLNRAAQQLAELCNHHEATLAGWAGELEGHALQDHTGAPDDGEG